MIGRSSVRLRRWPRRVLLAAAVFVLGCADHPPAASSPAAAVQDAGKAQPTPPTASGAASSKSLAAPGGAVAHPDVPVPVPPDLVAPEDPPVVVAIGDLHGDLAATRAALRLSGLVDAEDHWVGEDAVLVQTGDQVDRGDDEPEILLLFDRLAAEARAQGGAVYALLGNHEIMNAVGDLRYVTNEGLADFPAPTGVLDPRIAGAPAPLRGRLHAFLPGGPWARRLAGRNVAVVVGDAVFVHGGILPEHVPGLAETNRLTHAFLRGDRRAAAVLPRLMDPRSPVWTRRYGTGDDPAMCADARKVLGALGVTRLVVGHTVQAHGGITSACAGAVYRIDVGLSRHYGGPVQVLRLEGGRVEVLTAPRPGAPEPAGAGASAAPGPPTAR